MFGIGLNNFISNYNLQKQKTCQSNFSIPTTKKSCAFEQFCYGVSSSMSNNKYTLDLLLNKKLYIKAHKKLWYGLWTYFPKWVYSLPIIARRMINGGRRDRKNLKQVETGQENYFISLCARNLFKKFVFIFFVQVQAFFFLGECIFSWV